MKEDKPSLTQLKKWADRLLDATHKLVVGPNTYKAPIFPRIVEAAYRRDYLTLYTMRLLANRKPLERAAVGNSCMDLSRRVLEDVLSLEYMIFKGKEKMAKKFSNFRRVMDKIDLDYYKAGGLDIDPEAEKTILEEFDKVKKEFHDKSSRNRWKAWEEVAEYLKTTGATVDMKKLEEEFEKRHPSDPDAVRKNWAGLDVETMLVELLRAGLIQEGETRTILQTYKMGNNKNHFSPQDLLSFLYSDEYDKTGKGDMELALLITTLNIVRMAKIFIEEFDVPEEISKEVEAIWQELLVAHLPKKKKDSEEK